MAKKRIAKGGALTAALAAAGAGLVLAGTAGQSRAVLNYFSSDYRAQIAVSHIGVALQESNDGEGWREVSARSHVQYGESGEWEAAGDGQLLTALAAEDGGAVPGKRYTEQLRVQNNGTIGQYVRVTLYRYWTGSADGERDADTAALEPEYIALGLNEADWIVDKEASTKERTVLYYRYPLAAGQVSTPALQSLTIDRNIALQAYEEVVSEDGDGRVTYQTKPVYDGKTFRLEAEADAVQASGAQAAIKSAWGVDAAIAADGTLSL